MGVTLEGLVTNEPKIEILKGFKNVINEKHPNGEIKKIKEISFEDLMLRKSDDITMDFYEDEFGTIITTSHKFLFNFIHQGLSKFFEFNKFNINETSMRFQFDRCRKGKTIERILINDTPTRRIVYPYEDTISKFIISEDEDIFMESFPRFINELYTKNIHSINLENTAERYQLVNFDKSEYYFV